MQCKKYLDYHYPFLLLFLPNLVKQMFSITYQLVLRIMIGYVEE